MTKKYYFLLLCLLLFTFLLRIYNLDTNPAGFFCDEAISGVDAYSILHTGRDTHGDLLPLFFKGFNNDSAGPFHTYPVLPFVALFGLNEWSVRLAPVFWSTVEILIFYFLLREFIPKRFAFLGTFFLSLSPWHYHLSRTNLGDFYSWTLLSSLACLLFIKGLKTGKHFFYFLSALCVGFGMYSYFPSQLTSPLLFIFFISWVTLKKQFKTLIGMMVIFILILLPFLLYHVSNPHSFQRIQDTVGIFKTTTQSTNQSVNRLPFYTSKYLLHYSSFFLFQKGDTDFPGQFIRRHSLAGIEVLYSYQMWIVCLGILWLAIQLWQQKRYTGIVVIFLLVIYPIPDTLTLDSTPYATRSYLGVLPFHLLISFGFYYLAMLIVQTSGRWKKIFAVRLFLVIISILVFYSLSTLLIQSRYNPLTTSDYWGWQYGPRDIMTYFLSHQGEYDEFYMQGEFNAPEIFLKFYDPTHICKTCFIGIPKDRYNPARKQLFAVTPVYLKETTLPLHIVSSIYYPNGSAAFHLVKVN